jgi:hypothetical protein
VVQVPKARVDAPSRAHRPSRRSTTSLTKMKKTSAFLDVALVENRLTSTSPFPLKIP